MNRTCFCSAKALQQLPRRDGSALRVRQQQLSCGRAAAELRLHTARVAQLLESCARGTSAGKAGRCAACQARSVRAIDWQTSRVREQDRQKSWEGQEGDDQRARDERESAQRRCVVERRAVSVCGRRKTKEGNNADALRA